MTFPVTVRFCYWEAAASDNERALDSDANEVVPARKDPASIIARKAFVL